MAGFLYFVVSQFPTVDVKAAGLGYAFTGPAEKCQCNPGPGKQKGVVLCESSRHPGRKAAYLPDQQTWRKMPKVEGLPERWIGYWNDAKPTPEDLERAKMLRGARMLLADNQQWQVPIVRKLVDQDVWQCELPTYLDFDDDGNVVPGKVREEYAALWDATTPIADDKFASACGDDPVAIENAQQQLYAAVVALLQANYVVALPELIVLHALAEDTPATVALASCRYDTLVAWIEAAAQKKTSPAEASGETSSAGAAG